MSNLTNSSKILKGLKEPFPSDRIRWRVGATTKEKDKGIALAYIDARDVMNRFDEVCGVNWQVRHPREGYCEIGIKIDDEWIWRGNGAGETDVEGEKGQYSDSEKRAAVEWGVGRYLYYLPNEWVPIVPAGRSYKLANAPLLPKWALPGFVPRMDMELQKQYANGFADALVRADDQAIIELHAELDHDTELPYVWRHLNSAQRGTIKLIVGDEK